MNRIIMFFVFVALVFVAGIGFAMVLNTINSHSTYCYELFDTIDQCRESMVNIGLVLVAIAAFAAFLFGIATLLI